MIRTHDAGHLTAADADQVAADPDAWTPPAADLHQTILSKEQDS